MTASDLTDNGYKVSWILAQEEIDRAEITAKSAYVDKVCSATAWAALSDAVKTSVLCPLVFIALCRRRAFATRSGGKVKNSPSLSVDGYYNEDDVNEADRLLRSIMTVEGEPSKLVDDVFGIYYRTYYMAM